MNLEQLTLDQQIDQQHQALARAEADALQIAQRISNCPGAEAYVKQQKRNYGQCLNPWTDGNLSAQSAVLRHDRPLAEFLAARAGTALPTDYDRQQREAERAAAATRLAEQTAAMKAAREARQAAQQASRHPIAGEWDSFHGRWR